MQLDNTGGGLYSGAPGDLVVLNRASAQSYRNTASFTLHPGETGVLVNVQAIELGSAATSPPNTITAFETLPRAARGT